ncbi:HET-domain-containing protein [Hyaloscypha hepaticicola]|uniref:HET-domain-containing protein n=1 Tax=Hyaloscypha hepaticicola TaxID=2082293 RepID=A0A2J6PZ22_9HELO|nr:HET-domain-containing protein [Hyaloscypha hepaticicola]
MGDSDAIFSPIPSRRFRLIEVEPSLSSDTDINCSLTEHNLASAPSYTAISYVWGKPGLTSTIILNGKKTESTGSSHAALKGLRSRWRKKLFWIDAICIDQTSDTDKAEQISIMADIYRNAKQVTIWLGPEENGALALSLVRRLWNRTRLSDAMGSLTSDYSLDAPSPAWEAFRELLQNPWFQRSWVVQEVMSRKVIVQYGDATLD